MAHLTSTTRILFRHPERIRLADVVLFLVGLLAVAILVLRYGGFDPTTLPLGLTQSALHIGEYGVVAWLVLDRAYRFFLASNRIAFCKVYAIDLLFLTAFAVCLLWMWIGGNGHPDNYLAAAQTYMLLVLGLRAVNANQRIAASGIPTSWMFIGSFALLCLLGSALLMLPAAIQPQHYGDWSYLDSLFTATSATCVTGLVVVDTGTHFTPLGQGIILTLIQLGAIGLMLFGAILAFLTGKSMSMRSSETFGEMLGQEQIGGVVRVMRYVIFTTLIAEAVGATMLYPMFRDSLDAFGNPMSSSAALGHAIFHSVSAFCNAGFALYPANLSGPLASHWQILGTIAPLIILGGLGFIVLRDVLPWIGWQIRHRLLRKKTSHSAPRFSLHTKLVLTATVILLVAGMVGMAALNECSSNPQWAAMSTGEKLQASAFQSVTTRTAGFNTMDMDSMPDAAKFLFCGLMTIGGSPGGTAGGMKTITVVILLLSGIALLRRRSSVEVFGRTLPTGLLQRALTLAMIYFALLMTTTILLSMMLDGEQFIDVLFEASSACGTVGLSTGVTSRLTPGAELVITFAMFLGRLGPLTLIFALAPRKRAADYVYPEETVAVC